MINLNNILLFLIVTVCWMLGGYELFISLTNFSSEWYWIVLAMLYTCTINEIFVHEIMSHSDPAAINVNSITYKVLVFLNAVNHGYGNVTDFCLTHANHHIWSDTNSDHMYVKTRWDSNCILSPWNYFINQQLEMPGKEEYFKKQNKEYKHILNDPWTMFIEEFKIPLTLLFWAILFFTFPIILFKIVFMGRLLMSVLAGLANIAGHSKLPGGYRNFDISDNTYNHLIFHYLSLGLFTGMLHNNHHGLKTFETSQVRWFEFDTSRPINFALRFLMRK